MLDRTIKTLKSADNATISFQRMQDNKTQNYSLLQHKRWK